MTYLCLPFARVPEWLVSIKPLPGYEYYKGVARFACVALVWRRRGELCIRPLLPCSQMIAIRRAELSEVEVCDISFYTKPFIGWRSIGIAVIAACAIGLAACGGGDWEEGPDKQLQPIDCKATPEKCR